MVWDTVSKQFLVTSQKRSGTFGDDRFMLGSGDDKYDVLAGNDRIYGDVGIDSAFFAGKLTDFTATKIDKGLWKIVDKVTANGNLGTDYLTDIKKLVFSDKTITLN
jgi:hypothetical protein